MPPELRQFLTRTGLVKPANEPRWTALSGGVSCEVWRVELDGRTLCIKRALPRLRVDALWEAPVTRNAHECAWIEFAANVAPGSVPRLVAQDQEHAMFAMEFLSPSCFPNWKQLLLEGKTDAATAASVASLVARLHAASASNPELAQKFHTRETFYALRVEPYLLESARRNPGVAEILQDLARRTLATEIALVHGDVSPKNILIGPRGPVFLDAETAWYGDPAFDLAFCINHLLLKCLARPVSRDAFLNCFAEYCSVYLKLVSWENSEQLEARAARLLPALLLARVDGKSPVEYLTPTDRSFVRRTACNLIFEASSHLDDVGAAWRTALMRREDEAQ